jgi:hypothetical protein
MVSCRAPTNSTGELPIPEMLAVYQAPDEERQTLLTTVATLGAPIEPYSVMLADVEKASDEPVVSSSTAGVVATDTALASPRGVPALKPVPGGVTPSEGTHVAGAAAAVPVPDADPPPPAVAGFTQA